MDELVGEQVGVVLLLVVSMRWIDRFGYYFTDIPWQNICPKPCLDKFWA